MAVYSPYSTNVCYHPVIATPSLPSQSGHIFIVIPGLSSHCCHTFIVTSPMPSHYCHLPLPPLHLLFSLLSLCCYIFIVLIIPPLTPHDHDDCHPTTARPSLYLSYHYCHTLSYHHHSHAPHDCHPTSVTPSLYLSYHYCHTFIVIPPSQPLMIFIPPLLPSPAITITVIPSLPHFYCICHPTTATPSFYLPSQSCPNHCHPTADTLLSLSSHHCHTIIAIPLLPHLHCACHPYTGELPGINFNLFTFPETVVPLFHILRPKK